LIDINIVSLKTPYWAVSSLSSSCVGVGPLLLLVLKLNKNSIFNSCFKRNITMDTPSRSLDILDKPWVLRVYKKQKAIQIKPPHNKHIHFSIVWGNDITPEDFATMEKEIHTFLAKTPKLSFRIIRPCANCTYGRFDESFEDLIMGFRKRFEGVSAKKDLPLENEEHQDLRRSLQGSHDPWQHVHWLIFINCSYVIGNLVVMVRFSPYANSAMASLPRFSSISSHDVIPSGKFG
jgi:hypothetical protein